VGVVVGNKTHSKRVERVMPKETLESLRRERKELKTALRAMVNWSYVALRFWYSNPMECKEASDGRYMGSQFPQKYAHLVKHGKRGTPIKPRKKKVAKKKARKLKGRSIHTYGRGDRQ